MYYERWQHCNVRSNHLSKYIHDLYFSIIFFGFFILTNFTKLSLTLCQNHAVRMFSNKTGGYKFRTEDNFPKPIQIFQFNVQFGILSVALIHYKIKNISTYVEFLLKNIDSVGICIIWYIYYMFRPST